MVITKNNLKRLNLSLKVHFLVPPTIPLGGGIPTDHFRRGTRNAEVLMRREMVAIYQMAGQRSCSE
jgi:hypothetical protein